MKISFVIQDLIGGGVEYATAAMAREFSERGYEVEILVSKTNRDFIAEGKNPFSVPSAVKVIDMPSRRGRRNILFLRRYLKTTDAEYVIAETGIYADCIRIAVIGIGRHPKLVHVWHGDTPTVAKGWFRRIRQKLYYRLMYSKYHRMLTVNQHIKDGVLSISSVFRPEEITVVYNPVVDEEFNRKLSGPTQHPWLINKVCPTFVAAGAYDKNKGHMMLMQAIKNVNKRQRVRLVIFGRGIEEENFKEYVRLNKLEDAISLAGFCDNIPAEMKSADGFLLGTHVESFAIVIVEALACGIPVISTDAPFGPAEVLENGKYGVLVPVDDVEAMAKEIESLIAGEKIAPSDESWRRFTIESVYMRYLRGIGIE